MILFKGHHCATVFKKYSNGNTRIDLIDSYTCTPVTTATTSIDMLAENEVAIREFSDHIGILKTLVNAGIISNPVRYISSGYNNVPVCRLIKKPIMV